MIFEHSYGSKSLGIVVPTLGKRVDYLLENLQSLNASEEQIFVCVVRPKSCSSLDSRIGHLVDLIVDDPKNGLSGAINLGISSLPQKVKYVNWLGDDDYLNVSGLTTARKLLEKMNNVDFVFGNCRYIDSDGVSRFVHKPKFPVRFFTQFGPNQIAQPAVLFRRSSFFQVGQLDEQLELAMDLDLWLRFFKKKNSSLYIDEIIASFRWHPESLSSTNGAKARIEASEVRRRYLNFASKPIEGLLTWIANLVILKHGAKLDNIFDASSPPN